MEGHLALHRGAPYNLSLIIMKMVLPVRMLITIEFFHQSGREMVPVQHTLRLDHDGWPPYDHRRGVDNHTGGRCTTTGAGATTTGRGAETTATGTDSSKPTQTCTCLRGPRHSQHQQAQA